ncbi:MAG: hypothetical protein JO041_00340 [Acidobacteria bacterium]|nr:hypothetical protein [Acidobacteriota bacterium]
MSQHESSAEVPDLSSCANASCAEQFRRLGDGKVYAFPIDDPENWGLPAHLKQKVVWLCRACSAAHYVRLDRRRHRVQLVHRRAEPHGQAA